MNKEARMQGDGAQLLRSRLVERAWSYDLLAEYVSQLSQDKREDEIFHLLAFRRTNPNEIAAQVTPDDLSNLYESASLEEKINLRTHWHDEARRQAFKHDDLRARISWRYLV